ncbi:hypothetical protein CROQUDRAFT_99045 [Cronartium quercuum f. sp. fusiforme G11]|uniref:Uncharacterized protein n=1 Tax=Cronartium quercuum f. sp. fusiforme G11 TaxID=708437 RepID=A0A9P6N8E2_9BASI|nr:hypothetical protein CROQUDRAFT_99045 [Cronartium quercuum f. sp. fusiforme G11]
MDCTGAHGCRICLILATSRQVASSRLSKVPILKCSRSSSHLTSPHPMPFTKRLSTAPHKISIGTLDLLDHDQPKPWFALPLELFEQSLRPLSCSQPSARLVRPH